MKNLFFTLAFIAALAPSLVLGARILGLLAFSGKSHNHGFGALTAELASRGHDVTVVTPFPIKNPPGKYRIIDAPATRKFMNQFDQKEHVKLNIVQQITFFWSMISDTCPQLLQMSEVKELLNEKFDLIIVSMFFNDCFLPFAHHNKAPLILYSPAGMFNWVGVNMGNPEPTSYVPNIFLSYSNEMTFLQRAVNTALAWMMQGFRNFIMLPKLDKFCREYFGENTPSILEIESNASLALINNHVSLNYPRPLSPNVIEVGGLHIQQTNQQLPKDLQEFMDGATDGVIYFSMGSAVKLEDFPAELVASIVDTFKELPQRVIWKWNLDELPGQPKNVKIGKWLPQEAILAHPKLRLFISHGGLLSTQEAVYHGVPIVGVPVFGDQQLNVRQSELLGFAVGVNILDVNKETLSQAIHRVLSNPSFAEKARMIKKRVRDQPEQPLERAVFWTEYVLRHDGATHLQSSAVKLSWYQLYLLDVIFSGMAVIFIIVLLFRKCIQFCCISRNKKVQVPKQSTKKRQ